uniref:Transposase n=1 Tax=Heterorhabditis bacteriophora TaxID=37862 RepID=A0A1I7WCG9_HETBA
MVVQWTVKRYQELGIANDRPTSGRPRLMRNCFYNLIMRLDFRIIIYLRHCVKIDKSIEYFKF